MTVGAALSGAAVLAGVVGRPVVHSLSPLLHNAWIAAAGLDALYAPFGPADEAGFDMLVAAGRAGLVRGINVTAPFKERALASADTASATARRCGSANLMLFDEGAVHADSTDGAGVIAALAEQAPGLVLKGRPVALLGAGGAARAAAAALLDAGAELRVVNRTRERAERLIADLGAGRVAETVDTALKGAVLVVNGLATTPEDLNLGLTASDAAVLDMTYRPLETPLLTRARAAGRTPVDGLAMLIGQARPSFRALFGVDVPPIDVRALALTRLEAGA